MSITLILSMIKYSIKQNIDITFLWTYIFIYFLDQQIFDSLVKKWHQKQKNSAVWTKLKFQHQDSLDHHKLKLFFFERNFFLEKFLVGNLFIFRNKITESLLFFYFYWFCIYFSLINFSELLKKISNVTIDDLKSVGERYFMKIFDPSVFSSTLCCHPTKIDEILESFNE